VPPDTRASVRSAPKPHQNVIPCCQATSPRPASRPCCSTALIASAQRSALVQMPSQPSPSRPARRSAASDRPPTTSGIGCSGVGRTRARCSEKNSPSWSMVSPASRRRSRPSDSSIRRPRVFGSTPHASTSLRSSPPMPRPSESRPGANWATVRIWRATSSGWRSTIRYTARVDVELVRGRHHRSRVGEAVVADPSVEHHVIADHHVVDAGLGHPREQPAAQRHQGRAGQDGAVDPHLRHQVDAEADGGGGHDCRAPLRRSRNASLRSTISGSPMTE